MKKKIDTYSIVLVLLIIASISSCRKDVPPDKVLYIGTWSNNNGTTIKIQGNGKASYEKSKASSSGQLNTSESSTISGHIKFISGGFKITDGIFGKKFSVSKDPKLVENSTTQYIATINGEDFFR